MPLFLAFLLVPIIEITLFIQIGSLIGLFPTLAVVILTAMLGTWLVRTQGALALNQVRGSFEQLSDPTEPLAHGAMILFAGALLLTPGFFTDGIGFLLLIPKFRANTFIYLKSKIVMQSFQMGTRSSSAGNRSKKSHQSDVIDGEYEEVTPSHDPKHPSGWLEGPK